MKLFIWFTVLTSFTSVAANAQKFVNGRRNRTICGLMGPTIDSCNPDSVGPELTVFGTTTMISVPEDVCRSLYDASPAADECHCADVEDTAITETPRGEPLYVRTSLAGPLRACPANSKLEVNSGTYQCQYYADQSPVTVLARDQSDLTGKINCTLVRGRPVHKIVPADIGNIMKMAANRQTSTARAKVRSGNKLVPESAGNNRRFRGESPILP